MPLLLDKVILLNTYDLCKFYASQDKYWHLIDFVNYYKKTILQFFLPIAHIVSITLQGLS